MSGKPTLTVVLQNYNKERFLKDSFTAIINSTYTPEEIIIVDNGSTDRSIELYQEWIKPYSNIQTLFF